MEIELKNISYRKIIKKVNVTIPTSKITCIIGPIGSGKTTLLELIKGIKTPTSGSILIDENQKISFTKQFPEEQFFYKTVREELEKNLKIFNYNEEKINKKIIDSFKMVQMKEELLSKDPLTLKRDDMKKLSLALSLCINPSVLILDEPVSNMNYLDKQNVIKLLKTIKRKYNKTIIIATNDIEFVHLISDYVIAINNGQIILEGDKYKVFKEYDLLKENNISIPKIIEFESIALREKKIKLGYRDEINDLIKDILRKKEV